MRKRVSLILLISILMSLCSYVSAEEIKVYALKDEQKALLEAIEFKYLDKDFSDSITRAEFAYLTEQIAYDHTSVEHSYSECFADVSEDTKYGTAIASLYNMNVVRGYSEGLFRPEDNITTAEALVMASRLFNQYTYFDVEEQSNFAWKMNLSNGVDTKNEEDLNLYSAMIILLNTLDSDLYHISYYFEEDNREEYDTYLTRTFSVYPINGAVKDDGKISADGVRSTVSDTMVIGDVQVTREVSYKELYGRKIYSFCRKDAGGEYTILSYYMKGENSLLINSKDIEEFEDMRITYYPESNGAKTKTVKIPSGIEIVYNGVPVASSDNFTADMLVPEKGTVELYNNDKDSDYDICYVNDYVSYVVLGANEAEEVINTKNEVSFELENYDYFITDKLGNNLPLSHIWEDSIILVAKPLKSDILHIVVSSDSITDRITAYNSDDKEMITESQGIFGVSCYFEKYGYSVISGKTYNIFLDPFGEIAYVRLVVDADAYNVGYLITCKDVDSDENGDEYYSLKIIDSEAKEKTLKIAEKVTFFAAEETVSKRLKDKELIANLEGKTGIFRYKLDDYNVVTTVELPLAKNIVSEKSDRLCLLADTDDGSLRFIGYPIYSLGGVVNVNSSTTTWTIPKDRDDIESITIKSGTPFEHQSSYTVSAYGRNRKTNLADIVVYSPVVLRMKSYPMVITDIKYEYDEKSDESVYNVTGMAASVSYKYKIKEEVLNNPIDMFNKPAVTPLAKGDVIRYAEYNGEIIGYTLVYDADWDSGFYSEKGFISGAISGKYDSANNMGNPCATRFNIILDSTDNKYKINRDLTPLPADNFENGYHCLLGYVYSYEDGIINITNQDLAAKSYDDTLTLEKDGIISEKYPFTSDVYMTVTSERSGVKASKAAAGDIKPYTSYGNKCSKVLLCGDGSTLIGVFIMND